MFTSDGRNVRRFCWARCDRAGSSSKRAFSFSQADIGLMFATIRSCGLRHKYMMFFCTAKVQKIQHITKRKSVFLSPVEIKEIKEILMVTQKFLRPVGSKRQSRAHGNHRKCLWHGLRRRAKRFFRDFRDFCVR